MNNRKTKFLQPLKSIMDFKGLQEMQAAVNSLLNGKMTSGQVIYSDSNVIWDNKPNANQTFEAILPFTIYNIENNGNAAVFSLGTGYAVNDELTISGGILSSGSATKLSVYSVNPTGGITGLLITNLGNYSTQPTYPNNVTGGSGTGAEIVIPTTADNWRTFQIRDGEVSWRPKFPNFYTDNIPYNFPYAIQADSSYNSASSGNYEWVIQVLSDLNSINATDNPSSPFSQPIKAPNFSSVVLNRSTPTLIYGWETVTPNWRFEKTQFSQILLDDFATIPPGDVLNPQPLACFWLEIIDDPLKGLYVNLWGRMTGGGPGFPNTAGESFPVGKNIIPIGFCAPQVQGLGIGSGVYPITPTNQTEYIQLQCGNVVNRYPQAGGGLYKNYRGAWTADSLSGQLFYIGDEVIDDTAQVPYFIGYTGAVAPPDPGDIAIYAYAIYTYIGPFTIPPTLNGFNIETDPPSENSTNAWIQTGWTPVIPNALPI